MFTSSGTKRQAHPRPERLSASPCRQFLTTKFFTRPNLPSMQSLNLRLFLLKTFSSVNHSTRVLLTRPFSLFVYDVINRRKVGRRFMLLLPSIHLTTRDRFRVQLKTRNAISTLLMARDFLSRCDFLYFFRGNWVVLGSGGVRDRKPNRKSLLSV